MTYVLPYFLIKMQFTSNFFFSNMSWKKISVISIPYFLGIRSNNKNISWKLHEIECSYRNGIAQLCLALCITSDNIDYDAWIMPYQQHRCSPGAYLHSKSKWRKEIFNNFWVPFIFLCILCGIVKIVSKVSINSSII